jgi:hypothetical protein
LSSLTSPYIISATVDDTRCLKPTRAPGHVSKHLSLPQP